MRLLRPPADNIIMRIEYCSLFQSHLSYGVVLWGGSGGGQNAFILQKATICLIDAEKS